MSDHDTLAGQSGIPPAPSPAVAPTDDSPVLASADGFRALLEAAPDAMVVVDEAGRIVLVNGQTETLFGYERSALLGQPVEMLLPERYRQQHRRHRTRYAGTPHLRPMGAGLALWGLHRDGHEFPVEVSLSPVAVGEQRLVMSAIRDITERKELEARQATQYAVTRILADSPTVAEAIPRLLQALCEGLGWELGEFWQVDSEADVLQWAGLWHQPALSVDSFAAVSQSTTLARGQGLPGQVWAADEPRWSVDVLQERGFVRAAAATQLGVHGAVAFPVHRDGTVCGVMQFFSRAARAPEVALVQVMSDLGSQVGQFLARTAAEAALQQAKADADHAREAAEVANRAKSEFLSRMSHELRTPLNSVLGFAQLLELEPLTPAQQRSVARILRGGRHLLDLINEVLDITRIEAGRLQLSPEPVRIRDVVVQSLELVRPLAGARQITIDNRVANACMGYVQADRQRLAQVLLNLLANAVKYNREAGTVVVSCARSGPSTLRIAVRDTGPGIAPEQLPRLFAPFDRLGAESTGIEGTGLGLALSQRLVETMGGRIVVESVVGEGSTFSVELPEAEGPTERHGRMSGDALPAPDLVSGVTRTVLYIEDNLPNLELVEQILSRWPQMRLLSATYGRLGLDLAREHRPDLILLDLHLPDMNGAAVLRALQADEAVKHIPVVVVSADATVGQVKRLLAAGARAYLTKPLDVARFLKLLTELLDPEGTS